MAVLIDRLKTFIRRYFSDECDETTASTLDTSVKMKHRRRRRRREPPSERFVWAMVLSIIALIGVIVLEAIYIVVTKSVNNEMVAVISALVGSLATAFLMGKKNDFTKASI